MLQPILVRFLKPYLEFDRNDTGVVDYKTAKKLVKNRTANFVNPDVADKYEKSVKKGSYKTKVMYPEE